MIWNALPESLVNVGPVRAFRREWEKKYRIMEKELWNRMD